MKVLIVGGTGVISSAVVNEAVKQGVDVTCINRGNNHGITPNPMVTTLHFDVRNREVADEHLEGKYYDVVVDFICFNAEQTKYSLNLFQDKCNQYVFISTDSVYKLQKDGHYDETTPQSNPEWAYSYQKAECEEIVKNFCGKHHLKYTIVRPSITYGDTRIPYGFMPAYGYHYSIVDRIKAGKPVVCWNGGQNKQTIMRVEDFAQGMVGLWGNEQAYNESFGICGEVVTWEEVLQAIEEAIGLKAIRVDVPVDTIIKKLPSRKGEFLVDRASDHCVSNEKLRRAVPSFTINYPLKKGVATTISYYENNNKIHGIDYNYDGQCDMLIKTVGAGNYWFLRYPGSKQKDDFSDYLKGKYNDLIILKIYLSLKVRINKVIRNLCRNNV